MRLNKFDLAPARLYGTRRILPYAAEAMRNYLWNEAATSRSFDIGRPRNGKRALRRSLNKRVRQSVKRWLVS